MSTPQVLEINAETGEVIERDMTADELAAAATQQSQQEAIDAAAAQAAAHRTQVLTALSTLTGLSESEIAAALT